MQATAEKIDPRPVTIDDAYKMIPEVGGKVRIKYQREYLGISGSNIKGGSKMVVRRGEVIQKTPKYFTVRLIGETASSTKKGSYNVSFQYVDILIGRITVLGVSG